MIITLSHTVPEIDENHFHSHPALKLNQCISLCVKNLPRSLLPYRTRVITNVWSHNLKTLRIRLTHKSETQAVDLQTNIVTVKTHMHRHNTAAVSMAMQTR